MKRAINWSVLAGIFLAASCDPSQFESHDSVFDTENLLVARGEDLRATVISPHLAVSLEPNTNVLWCGTFQLAWNEVRDLIGEDLHFASEPTMVAEMNRGKFSKAHLDDKSYLAIAGYVRDGISSKIDREMKAKFQGRAVPHLLPRPELTPRPQDIVAYCYLFKHLEFATPFERIETPLTFTDGKRVVGFGMLDYKPGHEKLYPQVQILDYKSRRDYVIELKSKTADDRLILARVDPATTLGETIAIVGKRIASPKPNRARGGDVLFVPKLNFDLTKSYEELLGRRLVVRNPQVAKDLLILSARQNIRFQMNEKGAILRSESHISFGCSASVPPEPKHIMVFDGPFLIMLQRARSDVPYFALWVGNSDLLAKPE